MGADGRSALQLYAVTESRLDATVTIRGDVTASADLTIEGRIVGPVSCAGHAVVIATTADVTGDIFARRITVLGRAAGQLVATEYVDLGPGAIVSGCIVARQFTLDLAASFTGRVEPQHLEAAVRVAQFRGRQRAGLPSGERPADAAKKA